MNVELYNVSKYGANMLTYFIVFSEVISLCLLYKIWRGRDHLILKFILSAVTLIPLLGPVFYLMGADSTPRERNNLNAGGHLFGRGRYTEWWDSEKPRMKQKIKKLQDEAEEKNNNLQRKDN